MLNSKFFLSIFAIFCLQLTLIGCENKIGTNETVEITLCNVGVLANDDCINNDIVRILKIPKNVVALGISKKVNKYTGDFIIDLRAIKNIEDVAPYLAKHRKKYPLMETVKISANSAQVFDAFLTQIGENCAIKTDFKNELEWKQASQWILYKKFKIQRCFHSSEAIKNPENILPTRMRLENNSKLTFYCARDITMNQLAGCGVYDFQVYPFRLDYSDIAIDPNHALKISSEIHKIIDYYTIYPTTK
jgi:3-hydroxymyristoyl/3-hydroxydecanoyl-(acyl carrier protein) dehydratase